MIKKTPKLLVGLLTLCFVWCSSLYIPVYAATATRVLSGAAIINSDGSISIVSQSSRYIYYVELDNTKSGTIKLTYTGSNAGNLLFSSDDVPEDLAVGYTFISNDIHNMTTQTVSFSNVKYCYITTSKTFEYEVTYEDSPVDPTPTFTPTPGPTGSGGSGIPLDYDIPFDYYMIAIVILLGGILICQFFKN